MATTFEELVAASEDAQQRRDARASAALFHPNANMPTAGGFGVGREAIEKHFEAVLPMMPADLEHQVTSKNVHYVTPDLAIVDTVGETYRKTDGGRENPSMEGFTMIAVREQGEWLWAGVRGALVPGQRVVFEGTPEH